MKSKIWLIFFVLANLFALNSMELIPDDHCDAEDADMAQWFKQVNDFLLNNQNNFQNIDKIYNKLELNTQEINEKINCCLKEQQQQQQILALETKVSSLLEENNELKKQLQEQQQESNKNIVIQRRQDGSVDFYRNWDEYKRGFGNETGEFFIGLEKLHKLTNSRPYELLIVMEDWENNRRDAKYDNFVVGSENENFVLKSVGTYSGTAGDSLTYHVGQKFSTKDRDQDSSSGENCAEKYTGAWWYKFCHYSNLNGRYLKASTTEYASSVVWHAFKGYNYSLKFVEMILVPK